MTLGHRWILGKNLGLDQVPGEKPRDLRASSQKDTGFDSELIQITMVCMLVGLSVVRR